MSEEIPATNQRTYRNRTINWFGKGPLLVITEYFGAGRHAQQVYPDPAILSSSGRSGSAPAVSAPETKSAPSAPTSSEILFLFDLQTHTSKEPRDMSVFIMLLCMIASLVVPSVVAFCECGYATLASVNGTLTPFVFTDLLESDFLHIKDIASDTDWSRQNYSVTAAAARGPYGTEYTLENIISNPLPNSSTWSGPGVKGPDPGVQLTVSGGVPTNGYIPTAQMNSVRQDMRYGSFRALMKLPSISGTCSSFFWYFNNSQEIDMELLSSQFQPNPSNTFLINLVDQSLASVARGYAIPGTEYEIADLPFNPADGYHEYRIDFVPGLIIYYADNQVIGTLNGSIPSQPGHMILTQWSNGDPTWSGGPPATDAVLAIAGVRAYFNSSDPARQAAAATRCTDPSASDSICYIPDFTPSNTSLFIEYFSNEHNKTIGQTVYGKKSESDQNSTPNYFVDFIMLLVSAILRTTMFL